MSKLLVSIIIPFYNEERCLSRAVQSVLNQSYPNTEIILVNDGSTDNSKAMAEKLTREHHNISLINSLNGEPGAARNKGMESAKGSYLTFLDADDELEAEMVELCVANMVLNNCDIVNTGNTLFDTNGKVIKIFNNSGLSNVLTGFETIKAVYNNKVFPTSSAKLFKAEILKRIRFPENMWFQDNPFFLEVLFNSQRVGFIENSLVKVHSRINSITRRAISKKRIMDTNKAFLIELDLVKKYVTKEAEKREIARLIFMNHLSVMLDNFIVFIIDEQKITNEAKQTIQKCYITCLSDVKTQLDQKKLKLSIKKQILFSVLWAPKIVGWKIPILILHIFKNKKIKYLRRLKG